MIETTAISPKSQTPRKRRKWLRRVLWTLAVLVLLVIALLGMLQTNWAADQIRRIAENEVSASLRDARLEIGSLDGNLYGELRAGDVRLFSLDSVVVAVDTVRAKYNLFSLLFGDTRVQELDLVRPVVTARQLPDSTFDLLRIVPPEPATAEPSEPLALRFDRLRVSDGAGRLTFLSNRPDSTIHAYALSTAVRDLYIEGDQFGAALDTAHAMIVAPVAPDTVFVSVKGELGEDRLICTDCTLASKRSNVALNGHLLFPDGGALGGELTLRLDPLVLGDVAFALPSVRPDESVAGEVEFVGTFDSLQADLKLDFSSGAAADLAAWIERGDSARVRMSGNISGFDPSLLVRTSDLAGTVNADIDVDLKGPGLDAVSGPASIRIFDTVLDEVELRDGFVRGEFDQGTGRLESRLYLPGISLETRGTLSPFADTVGYNLTGTFEARDLSQMYEALTGVNEAAGSFEIMGRGTTLESSNGRASLDLTRLVTEQLNLGPSRLRATIDGGSIALNASARLESKDAIEAGSVSLDASIRMIDDRWHAVTRALSVSDLNLSVLVSEAPPGLLSASGRLSAEATVDSLFSLTGDLNLTGEVGPVSFSEATVEANFAGRTGSYDLALSSSVGGGVARGEFSVVNNGYRITSRGRMTEVNVDTLVDARLATSLSGTISLESVIGERGLTSLSIDARLGRSAVNDQILDGVLLTASLADSTLRFDLDADLPNGSLSGAGSLRPFDQELTVTLTEASFSHIDVGAWLDEESLTTDLNGDGAASIRGSNIEGAFELSASRINRATIREGRVRLGVSDSTAEMQTSVEFDRGSLAGTITAQLAGPDTTYQGVIRLQEVDVAGLAGVDSLTSNLSGGCSFLGKNFVRPRLEASALCTARSSRFGEARIDSLRLETRLDEEGLVLSSMTIQSNIGRVVGSGSIPASARNARSSSEIDLVIELADLSPAAQLVGARDLDGDGKVTLTIGGSLESPSFFAEAALEYLTYDAYRVSSLDGFLFTADYKEGNLIGAVEVGFSVFNDVPLQLTSLEMERSGDVFVVTADTRIDSRRNGRISARYEERGDVDFVVVDALDLNLDGEIWRLSEEASFEIGEQWSVQTFLLFSDDQQIALDGYIDPDGEQNLIVTLDQIRLGAFTDLVGYQGVEGTGEGYIVLSGPHDDLELESNARVQGLKTYGREVGNFDLTANYSDAQMSLDGRLSHSEGATLTMAGFLPMRLTMTGLEELSGTEPVDLAVRSDSIRLAWIRPFLDQTVIDRIDGHLVCDIQIGGTWDDPGLSGSATLNGGRVRLPEFKLDMRSVAGTFRLDGNQLLVDKATAVSKGGTVEATGSVGFRSLDDPTFDLDGKFNKFRAISTETYQITVTGTGRLTGSMINPVFSGNVEMQESDIFMTEELIADEVDPVRLTDRDLRILERRFGYRVATEDTTQWDFYEALDLNVETSIGRDVWFRSYANPKMDIEFSGDLTVSKDPLEEEIVSGTITVNPSRSRVISLARKFEITTGEIQFNGLIDDALVDIQAQYVVPSRFGGDEVKIKLEITGTVEDMRLNLTSEPQMDTGAMVSYLTTGRPPGEASVGGTQAAEIAVSGLSNLVEGFANSELGLDVVEIQVNPTRGTSLTVGKYVSPKVYISLTQPLVTNDSYQTGDQANQTQMAIEYELISWLVAQLASSRNQLQVNMIWEFAF